MNGFKWFMQQEKPQPHYLSLTAPQTGGGGYGLRGVGWGLPKATCGKGGHTEVHSYVWVLYCFCSDELAHNCRHKPTSVWGQEKGERQVVKFLLPQIVYQFSPPQKSPECETAASATAVQTKTPTDSEHLKCPLTCSTERANIMNVGFQQTVLTTN